MQQAFVDLNTVRTNVLTYGRWIEESSSKPGEDLILVIPGNPGVTAFYKLFIHTLHEKTGYPVWIVGHAGHELPKNNSVVPIPSLKGNEKLFGLQGQLEHKKDFIKKYVPENVRLHLVGHSIGSYIISNLLKDESIRSRVVDVNYLFPAIERMAQTPNGKFMNCIKAIIPVIVFLSWIFTILPSILQNALIYCYMKVSCVPKLHFNTVRHFVNPSVLQKVFFMAYEELEQVEERDNDAIKENIDKLKLLYGRKDGWAPPDFCDNLKSNIPNVYAELSDYDHAYVLRQSREVGTLVGQWIKG